MTIQGRKIREEIGNQKALKPLLPLLKQMEGLSPGSEKYHEEEDLLEHTLMVYDEMKKLLDIEEDSAEIERDTALLMALSHDIGKLLTQDKQNDALHDLFGSRIIEMIYTKTTVDREIIDAMQHGCEQHLRIKTIAGWNGQRMNPSTIIDTVQYYGAEEISLTAITRLAVADARGREPTQEVDLEAIRRRLEMATEVVETVDTDYVLDKRDSSMDDYEDSAIRQMQTQDRVELLKEKINQ